MAGIVDKKQVPLLFHEPYVESGFRPIHQPWKNYFFSIFQWHNEVMNVWTHLLGLFMVIIRGGYWCFEFHILSDPYKWPIGVSLVTMIALYSCSVFAHCFHNRSEHAHYVCFMLDYMGIGMYGFGSTMLHYWYSTHEAFIGSYFTEVACFIGALLGVFTCYCCSISKVLYQRPYPFARRIWQMGSVLSIYLWLSIPVWLKILMYVFEGRWCDSFGDHMMQTAWFALGGFFFGSDVPQRYFPGKFDFVGHSHQLFHVCILMTTCNQMDGVYTDVIQGIDALRLTPAPSWMGTWGLTIFVLIASAVVVLHINELIKKNLLDDYCKKEFTNGDGNKGSNGQEDMQLILEKENSSDGRGFEHGEKKENGECCASNGDGVGNVQNLTNGNLRHRNELGTPIRGL